MSDKGSGAGKKNVREIAHAGHGVVCFLAALSLWSFKSGPGGYTAVSRQIILNHQLALRSEELPYLALLIFALCRTLPTEQTAQKVGCCLDV